MKYKFNMKGQTLIEVLVALGLIGVIATVLSTVVLTSLGNARFSKDQSLATQYAQEGLEIIRLLRDKNYTVFRNISNGTYCLAKDAEDLSPDCQTANVDNFLRRVTVVQAGCAVSVARVSVIVSWQDSKCASGNPYCRNSNLETCLSTVNPVPTL